MQDWKNADVPKRTKAALKMLEQMTLHPNDIGKDLIEDLYDSGLDVESISGAGNVGYHYNFINRIADAINFPIPQGGNVEKLAKILNLSGKLMKGRGDPTAWILSKDGLTIPPEVDIGREHLFTHTGSTDPELRRNVDIFVQSQWAEKQADVLNLSPVLSTYMKKLALNAYKISDEDVEAMREEYFSDEMIYELTIVGANAAAIVGLEKLYAVLFS
ncbi:MAG TPA: hypothetical protein G4N92_05730 [Anaerolineae bacterium]|nr:hypothetical protein [Anaerolineae bacterium]